MLTILAVFGAAVLVLVCTLTLIICLCVTTLIGFAIIPALLDFGAAVLLGYCILRVIKKRKAGD